MIKKYGGKPLVKYGYDGMINGKPVEVRSARKDSRYRIQKNVHNELVRKKGSYIFVKNGRSKRVSASKVSKKLNDGKWFKDRKPEYKHKFLKTNEVF